MKIAIAGRKILLLIATGVIFYLVINQRRAASDQISDLEVRYDACKRHAESLATQLEVVNSHKKKIEGMLEDVKLAKDFAIQDCELKLNKAKEDVKQHKENLESCQKQVPAIPQIHMNGATSYLPLSIFELQVQNQKYKEEITSLKAQLEEHQTKLRELQSASHPASTSSIQHAENEQNLVLPEPKRVEENNYVGKNAVHFQRSHSVNQNLEFKRGASDVKLPEILSGKQLIKKFEEKHADKVHNNAEEREKVVDYRNPHEPDANEDDYKENGH